MRDILHATLVWLRLAVDTVPAKMCLCMRKCTLTRLFQIPTPHSMLLSDSSRITDIDSALAFPGPLFHEISSGDMIADGITEARKIKALQSFINHRLQNIREQESQNIQVAVDRLLWQTLSCSLQHRGDLSKDAPVVKFGIC